MQFFILIKIGFGSPNLMLKLLPLFFNLNANAYFLEKESKKINIKCSIFHKILLISL